MNDLNFPYDFINKFICGDTIEVMKQIPDESIDLIVTSPPYNMRRSGKNSSGGKWKNSKLLNDGYKGYSDNMPHDEYVEWQRACLTEMLRIISEDGAIFYNHKWRIQSGILNDRHDIINGFPVRQIIIWKRQGGFNFSKTFFLPTYEVLYLIAKPKFKLVDKANAHTDVWAIGQERKNVHPAPFPEELAERIISSTDADIVLDPFMGSGTTAIAAKNLEREFIGIDISPEYCEMAKNRLINPQSIVPIKKRK